MHETRDVKDRRAAALFVCADCDRDLDLMPALCHRRHRHRSRSEVLRRADRLMAQADRA